MKKIIALVLVMVMCFGLAVYADEAETMNVTVAVDGETVLTLKAVQNGKDVAVNVSINAGGEAIEVLALVDSETVKFSIPAMSSDVYVLPVELFNQLAGAAGGSIAQADVSQLIDSKLTLHAMTAVMKLADAVSPLMGEDSIAMDTIEYTLPYTEVTGNYDVIVIAPTADSWKAAITDVAEVIKTERNVEYVIDEACKIVVSQAPAGTLGSAEELSATVKETIAGLADSLLAQVDDIAAALGSMSVWISSGEDGSRSISLETEEDILASAAYYVDEDGIINILAVFGGEVALYAQFYNDDESAIGDIYTGLSSLAELELYYEFDKTDVSVSGLPAGLIDFSVYDAELEVLAEISGDDTVTLIDVSVYEGESEEPATVINIELSESSDEVMLPEGNEVMINSVDELQSIIAA